MVLRGVVIQLLECQYTNDLSPVGGAGQPGQLCGVGFTALTATDIPEPEHVKYCTFTHPDSCS